ncbi:hypothetical protein BZG36_04356 [Bifiguratus adelaidae]|uniref:NAD-dependent epimerase/dehydratase domain-containing protein n=1 Tax=Bifiguratus adelaidae TaxID=1938954 RepID=A0A261XWT3_9FUNG|nr:hypothetical protein BZG36_04356 [Bifiguratus adelaidae]
MQDPSHSRVLVTGITGYLASHAAKQLLEAGYHVIGTARNMEKANALRQQFAEFGRFEVAEVKDLEDAGAYDELIKNIDYILHIASPLRMDIKDPLKDMVYPAVNGTTNVLNAAYTYGTNVKHVVVTSSLAAVAWSAKAGYTFDEKDWNDEPVNYIQAWTEGDDIHPGMAYMAAKNAAERAVWEFRAAKNPKFGIATIQGDNKEVPAAYPYQAFVDVRDAAKAHIKAMELGEKSDGERFIVVEKMFTWQELVDILRGRFPDFQDRIPKGTPGENYETMYTVSGEKAAQRLAMKYIDLETSVVETVTSLKQFW